MTHGASSKPDGLHEWSLHFWAHLARFVDGPHHCGPVLDAETFRLEIEPSGPSGGVIRIYLRESGTLRESSRFPFELVQPPVAVAHDVAKRLHAPAHAATIDTMHKADFLGTLRRALTQSPGSHDAVTLEIWAQRLLPYFQRQPGLTVGEALKQYHADAQQIDAPPKHG